MATTTTTHRNIQVEQGEAISGWKIGFAVFAGAMMLINGIFQFLEGLAAIFNDQTVAVVSGNAFVFDTTTWGWAHLILGAIIAAAGLAVFSGRPWGRFLGIFLASLSMIANFFFIPYYPFWALLIIALDIAIIAALAAFHPKNQELEESSYAQQRPATD